MGVQLALLPWNGESGTGHLEIETRSSYHRPYTFSGDTVTFDKVERAALVISEAESTIFRTYSLSSGLQTLYRRSGESGTGHFKVRSRTQRQRPYTAVGDVITFTSIFGKAERTAPVISKLSLQIFWKLLMLAGRIARAAPVISTSCQHVGVIGRILLLVILLFFHQMLEFVSDFEEEMREFIRKNPHA